MGKKEVLGKVVYLAGPYSGSGEMGSPEYIKERDAHVAQARSAALELWKAGAAVICPHLNSYDMDDLVTYETFLCGYLQMLERADMVVLLPGWQHSRGARLEREHAIRKGLPIIEWMKM